MRHTLTLFTLLFGTFASAQRAPLTPDLSGNGIGERGGGCDPPAVQSQPPASIEMCQGDSVLLEIAATGTDLHYFWMKNGSFIGADASSFMVTPFPGLSATFSCLVHGQCGQVNVEDIVVHEIPVPQPSIGESGGMLVCFGPASSYQWYVDGQLIPDATGSSITPQQNGSYVVKAANGDCVGTSLPYFFGALGVQEVHGTALLVRHTPGTDEVLISGARPGTSVDLFDLTGQRLRSAQVTSDPLRLRMDGAPEGIYVVRVGDSTARILR